MNTSAAIKHFGSVKALATALQISPQAVYQWGATVPDSSAYKLESLTAGALRVRRESPRATTGAPAVGR